MQLSEQFTCFGVLNYGIIIFVLLDIVSSIRYNPEFNTQTHKKAQ